MSARVPLRPVPGQRGPHSCGPYPAPPFNPTDYWATKKWVERYVASSWASIEARLDSLEERVIKIETEGIPDSIFNEIARRVGLAYKTDLPTLEGESFRLETNNDLYNAAERIIQALGGTLES